MTNRLTLALILLMLALPAAAAPTAGTKQLPKPVQALQKSGVQIVGKFETPAGMTAYAGMIEHRPVAIYLTENGRYAVVGSMVDSQGRLVNRNKLQQMVVKPMSRHIWSQLKKSVWVPDGNAGAPRTLYIFSDPNCPYCHMFWKRMRPWVKSGKVQLRHIPVGVISKSSPNKAAAILAAAHPEQALNKNEQRFSKGGITPMKDIPENTQADLHANLQLMQQLGFRGTPGIIYRDDQGYVQFWHGVPSESAIKKVLGPH